MTLTDPGRTVCILCQRCVNRGVDSRGDPRDSGDGIVRPVSDSGTAASGDDPEDLRRDPNLSVDPTINHTVLYRTSDTVDCPGPREWYTGHRSGMQVEIRRGVGDRP